MLFISNRDIEVRCDENVLQSLGIHYKKQYATTLLNLEETYYSSHKLYTYFTSTTRYFNKAPLEERILLIIKNNKFSLIRTLCSWTLISIITFGFATSYQKYIITFNTEPIVTSTSSDVDIPLTIDNTNILYDGLLLESFEKNLTLDIKNGKYLCIVLANYAIEPLHLQVTMNKFIDAFGHLNFWRQVTCYEEKCNTPYSRLLCLDLFPYKNGLTDFNIQINNTSNKQIYAKVKIMQVKDTIIS